jgi:serine/threonine protein phosphatase PrpC
MVRTPPTRLERDSDGERIRVSVGFLSDIGCVRQNNEDALVVADLAKCDLTFANGEMINWLVGNGGLLLCVADGLGGANAGEVAASMTVEGLPPLLEQNLQESALAIDSKEEKDFKRLYGEVGYTVVDDVLSLPERMPNIYRRLTT